MAIDELQNGRYRHLRLLGSGGMGEVYLMEDTRVNRQVAIKVLHAEGASYPGDERATNSARLFEREARAIAALDHPNILPLYDFGEEEREDVSMTYMVMPYCTDGSLETWLRQRGGEVLTPQEVAALIEQAAEALQYAHEQKVIHLDVKPPNFLIRNNRKDPRRPTLLLADFGIARNFTTVSSSSRTIRGTPAAMSPEQWSGEPVFASDQYSLAVMAYEMLVGRPPFTGSLEQLMYRHFTVQPPPSSSFNPRLPAALDEVLLRALRKKPEERFPSIIDFANALSEAASQPATYAESELVDYGTLMLSQSEADAGISRMLTLAGGEEVTISVPAGAQDGQVLRLPGASSSAAEQAGLVVVNIAVKPAEKPRSVPDESRAQTPGTPLPSRSVQAARSGLAAETPSSGPVQAARSGLAAETPPLRQVSLSAASQISMPEHDQPTVAGLRNGESVTMAPVSLAQPRRRFGVFALVSLLVVLLLLAGSIYVYASRLSQAGAQSAPTHVVPPTPTATPSPAPAPGLYIAGTYNGSLGNDAGLSESLSVYLIQTKGSGVLTGSATFNSSAQHNLLRGTVDMQGNFIFTVQQSSGLPYIFYGAVESEVNLHGSYCRTSASSCPAADGFFTVGPRY